MSVSNNDTEQMAATRMMNQLIAAPGSATGNWIETDVRGDALSEKILSGDVV